MIPIIHPDIESYLTTIRPARDAVLLEMEALAATNDFPIVGPDVGALLANLVRFSGARRVLELGSGYGYSALWIAEALPSDGEVHCTETNPENRDRAVAFFKRANQSSKLHFHLGDALDQAARLTGPFDLILNDIDKEDYPRTIETALRLLRPSGMFLTDNALWGGRVAEPEPDAATRGVLEFNRALAAHPAFVTVILPLRDGISLAVKSG